MTDSHNNLELILSTITDGILVVDQFGVVVFANESAEKIFERGDLVGKDLAVPVNPNDTFQDINLIRRSGIGWAELRSSPIVWGGQPGYVIGVRDVTQRKRDEQELSIAAIAFESQAGMVVTDPNAIILRVNRAFTTLTGYSAEEARGQTPHLLSSGRHDKAFYQAMWAAVKEAGYWQGEIWNRRKNGKIYAEWLTISAVTDSSGNVTYYVGTFSDITQNKEAEAEIHRLAYFDHLTQLPNRRLLQDRLGQSIASVTRTGLIGAVLFLDLDNFKSLNDTKGHDAGDQLLIEVAQRLRSVVREGDTLARLGGDEFVVILEDLGTESEVVALMARQIAQKILDVLNQPYQFRGFEFHSTASIGISLYRERESVEDLLKHADLAMYQAKSDGRNTLRFFDPAMQEVVTFRAAMEKDLHLALEHHQFKLHFQPQVNQERQIIGAEVLLRWQHPERGLISPNEFISLAEETGLILPIGQWVLESSCAQLKIWENNKNTEHLQLAVNVSPRQFRQSDFVELVMRAVNLNAINSDKLKLEITESMLLANMNETIVKMNVLREMGIKFSMDDFGTGFSSLSYLTRLPLQQLKIDQSFVHNIGLKPADATIVQTIIGMAHNLGMDVIAEGVETEDQKVFLEQHGCLQHQGFLFSKPVSCDEFELLGNKI